MTSKILSHCVRIAKTRNTPSKHSEYGRFHHFSFVVQNNRILELGTNLAGKSIYSRFYLERCKVHSETDAYRKAKGLLDSANTAFEIVNIRLNKAGDLRNSKPCECCQNFLGVVGAAKVWYSTATGFAKVTL